ncbi:cephalosporin hydroxylase family protein [Polynucleobacter sp.]|uniref:cephalosporin hydroxylase family protein n=1 Tax=Polynucleobacter sp. TaxID=2029855 RepID=UPI003F69FC39
MNLEEIFKKECLDEINQLGENQEINHLTHNWMKQVNQLKYSYHFEWQGRPIIQYPQDIVATQELIWNVKPDLIIETGIAHGGSLILSASMLALLDMYDAIHLGVMFDPKISSRKVLGIDIDIRPHNRAAIEKHPLSSRIEMLEGSSIDDSIIKEVYKIASGFERVMVFLDSNHTHDHVLAELEAYAPLTTKGSYCVVFDTIIEQMPKEIFTNRPWGPGNNPKTALLEYLKSRPDFEIDKDISNKLLISMSPDGFLLKKEG